jgi:hypothetical protein
MTAARCNCYSVLLLCCFCSVLLLCCPAPHTVHSPAAAPVPPQVICALADLGYKPDADWLAAYSGAVTLRLYAYDASFLAKTMAAFSQLQFMPGPEFMRRWAGWLGLQDPVWPCRPYSCIGGCCQGLWVAEHGLPASCMCCCGKPQQDAKKAIRGTDRPSRCPWYQHWAEPWPATHCATHSLDTA